MKRHRSILISIWVFVLLSAAGLAIVRQQERILRSDQRQAAARIAAAAAFSVEEQLSRSLSAAYALAAVVRQRGGVADFDALAAEMFPLYPGVASLQLAPGGVVTHVYPLRGNEVVLGHDLLRDPDRRFQAREAVEKRTLVVAGPFNLRQGGTGLVGRLAIFLPGPAGQERMWGFATVVVRLSDLVSVARLESLPAAGYGFELARVDRETRESRTIASASLAADADKVSFPVEVPGGEWILAVAPVAGWREIPWAGLQYGAALVLPAALAFLAFIVLRQPERLRRLVAERTAELAADVDRRRRVEAALSLTQQVVDRAEQAIAWVGKDERIAYANDAFRRVVGLALDEAASVPQRIPALPPDRWAAIRQRLREGSSATCELTLTRAAEERQIVMSFETVQAGDGQLTVVFARDVTAERRTDEQLRHAQKMEAIGHLAGGVAHDFNNLLTGIVTHAALLREDVAPDSEASESVDAIATASRRATELTRQLLGFARRGKLLSAPFDAHGVILEVARLLERTLDKRIALDLRLAAWPSVVHGDPGQLQQAVLNLAVNARDAMPDGGVLSFATAVVDHDSEWCARHPGTAPGPHLAITIGDTGHGVPPELQERIFEPFFTTKEPGRGTGMGLAMVYGFARHHGGAVQLSSALDEGARFTVFLPLSGSAVMTDAVPHADSRQRGTGLVLVVDDDEIPRSAAASILARAGFEVVTAEGGAAALEVYRARSRELAAVLLDLAMPGMDGGACFEAMRHIEPRVPVVLTSGYARNGRPQQLLDAGVHAFVPKPFEPADLAEAVRAATQRRLSA